MSVLLSDHMGLILSVEIPKKLNKLLDPRSRPLFKIKAEVTKDSVFKMQLKEGMRKWMEVKQHCSSVLSWWDLCVKPNIRRLAIQRSKEINRSRRSRLNILLLQQSHLTSLLQSGDWKVLPALRSVQLQIRVGKVIKLKRSNISPELTPCKSLKK